jgi:hypothetical protein
LREKEEIAGSPAGILDEDPSGNPSENGELI